MKHRLLLDSRKFALTIDRLCYQLIENHQDFSDTVLIGVQPRGVFLGERIRSRLLEITGLKKIKYGRLDTSFHRDDFGQKPIAPRDTDINFTVEGRKVVLIDDVLFSGRTIRSAIDALMDFGRPAKVELLTLVDRRFSRHIPVQPDYVGQTVDAVASEKVKVEWKETDGNDKIWIVTGNKD